MYNYYLVFIVFIHLILGPLALIFHDIFVKIDCHASIIVAIIFTSFVFGVFNFCKDWATDTVSKKRIKQMWSLHFPHFPYEDFSSEILNNKFLIYITDNGLGIPKEDIEKIFTPFGRSLRTKEIEGSGLGLATCLKIVKSYNGEINVEDNSKTGSTFTIIFPLDLLDEEISLKP